MEDQEKAQEKWDFQCERCNCISKMKYPGPGLRDVICPLCDAFHWVQVAPESDNEDEEAEAQKNND